MDYHLLAMAEPISLMAMLVVDPFS